MNPRRAWCLLKREKRTTELPTSQRRNWEGAFRHGVDDLSKLLAAQEETWCLSRSLGMGSMDQEEERNGRLGSELQESHDPAWWLRCRLS